MWRGVGRRGAHRNRVREPGSCQNETRVPFRATAGGCAVLPHTLRPDCTLSSPLSTVDERIFDTLIACEHDATRVERERKTSSASVSSALIAPLRR
jgi:hypothetical protein